MRHCDNVKSAVVRSLLLFLFLLSGFPSFAAEESEYGDIIKKTQEYKKITTPKDDDDDDDGDRYYHHYHYPTYPRPYPPPPAYYRPSGSGGGGLSGRFYLGVSIGNSEFDYDDIEDGDASIFHFGYRPDDSHLGYEFSVFDSGDAQVTSLTDIELEVESFNLVLTLNSASNDRSRLNLFAQGGIYFANTTLSGPFDSVTENSNGFLLAVGVGIMLNRHFGLRAEALHLFDVEDFADDESISAFNLGGQFTF